MVAFIGRRRELALMRARLDRVARNGTGVALAIRGRRQVGKSRLAQEFCDRAGVPYLFFTATKGASPVEAITAFLADLRDSGLPVDSGLLPEAKARTGPMPSVHWHPRFLIAPLSSFSMKSAPALPSRMRPLTARCRPHGTGCSLPGRCFCCCSAVTCT